MSNIAFTIPSPKQTSYTLTISDNPSRSTMLPAKKPAKPHVRACANCKKAHLACDSTRPCKRCISADKADTCHDIQHKKRGRPKTAKEDQPNKSKTKPSNLRNAISLAPEIVMSSFSITQPAGSVFVSRKNSQMMTIVLTMDLCCSRVSDESLDFFGLYPQEFSHRSLYDFLLSDSSRTLARIHRGLLDNATNQHRSPLPATPRSSSDLFFSAPASSLLSIANGSLTLKDKMKFRGKQNTIEVDTNFYLGGGLGADLFDESSLEYLYIVCILSGNDSCTPTLSSAPLPYESRQQSKAPSIPTVSTVLNLASLLHQTSPLDDLRDRFEDGASMFSIFENNNMDDDNNDNNSNNNNNNSNEPIYDNSTQNESPVPSFTSDIVRTDEEDNTIESVGSPPTTVTSSIVTTTIKMPTKSIPSSLPSRPLVNDNWSDQQNPNAQPSRRPPLQQFVHPNEMYYTQTTSSRLSSEAVAHTTFPYLSTPPVTGICSVNNPNNQFSLYRKNSNIRSGYSKYARYS